MTQNPAGHREPRKLIVRGGDFRARTSARVVAVSRCDFTLRARKYIEPCERAFVEFEEILRSRDDRDIKYEWENVVREGLHVTFDVNWFDLEFFQDRKLAYRVGPHPLALQRFGAVPDDLVVRHRRVGVSRPRAR